MDDLTPKTPNETPELSRCPICRQPVQPDADTFPFCGSRCRLIDLGRWLDGNYLISRPIEQSDLDEE
ncbi:MAG: DNA gyrase inhibitor YacG [Phycisphaeraceae bacterium]|nr:DNA gyrase inhibitor YacG [Phycisphaeraceae bacterium]